MSRFEPTVPMAMQSERSDADLLADLRRGDLTTLDVLFHRHAGALLRIAYALVGSRSDAEDVVQDVFVSFPLSVHRYEERGSAVAWLKAVTVRTALARRRTIQRRLETDYGVEAERSRESAADPIIDRLALETALRLLTAELRDVFVLKEIEGYSHGEIAEILGIRRGTSEVRFFRAVRRLRQILEEK